MWYLYGFVLLAGVANAVQAGQNGALSKGLAQSLTAGLVVVAGTATCILVVGLLTGRLTWPSLDQAVQMPWWAWFGGLMGGGTILAQFFIARQIGAATFLGMFVTAGVVTSILLDHFGWVGFEQQRAGLGRIDDNFPDVGHNRFPPYFTIHTSEAPADARRTALSR